MEIAELRVARPCDRRNLSCVEPVGPSANEMAIGSARLLHCSLRREHWLGAAAEATRELLADSETSPWLISARAARRAAGTAAAAVWLPPVGAAADSGLRLGAFDGIPPDEASIAMMGDTAVYERIRTGREPVLSDDGPRSPSMLMIPLLASDEVLGVLTLPTQERDSPRCPAEQLMIAVFCGQTALACQLAQAQRELRLVAVYADRDRIARNLHDQVIQQLFGAGLMLQSLEQLIAGEPAKRVHDVVERLDHTITEIRRSIFSLHIPEAESRGLREGVVNVALEAAEGLGFSPQVHLVGSLNDAALTDVVDDVLAVVTEGLANVARHARATAVTVEVTADDRGLCVEIVDNGVGLGAGMAEKPPRGTGMLKLVERAEQRGGHCDIGPPPDSVGVRLIWRVPVS